MFLMSNGYYKSFPLLTAAICCSSQRLILLLMSFQSHDNLHRVTSVTGWAFILAMIIIVIMVSSCTCAWLSSDEGQHQPSSRLLLYLAHTKYMHAMQL